MYNRKMALLHSVEVPYFQFLLDGLSKMEYHKVIKIITCEGERKNMSDDLMRKKSNNILTAINGLIADVGLNDVKTTFDSKTGIASVIGNKDGFQYTTTLTKHMNGVVQTTTQFATNLGKEALISQIKALRKQGYKQQQIADMLKISQATVSKYLRK